MAYRDEIARLEAMHAANPDGRVFAHLAEAYRKAGDLERAREVLSGGLERHPQYASAHVVLGRVLLDQADRAAADSAFRRVLELDPHNMVALRARADIAHEQGNDHAALRFYRELITLDPSDEGAVLRIAEIESRPLTPEGAEPASAEAGAASAKPAEPGWGEVEVGAPPTETAEAIEAAPPTAYGEASLPEVAASEEAVAPAPSFDAADFGAVSIDAPMTDVPVADANGDVDMGLGGRLEPTDVRAAAPKAEMPDAVVDLSGLGGAFTLPPEPVPADDPGLPGFDEIAADATPTPARPSPLDLLPGPIVDKPRTPPPVAPLPTAPADEPAPAPAPAAGEPDLVDTPEEFHALWTTYDDGAALALPDVGPELVTETIGDLYALQGLHDRAADVFARLLEKRPGDGDLKAKLEKARAAAKTAGAAPTAAPSPMPIPRPVEAAPLGAFAAPEPTPVEPEMPPEPVAAEPEPMIASEPEPVVAEEPERTPLAPEPVATFPDGELPQAEPEPAAVEPEPEPEAPSTPAYTSSLPWHEALPTALPVPEAPGAREPEPFGLPAFADFGTETPLDLPVLPPVEDDSFGLPPIPETPPPDLAAAMLEPIVPIEELGMTPVAEAKPAKPPVAAHEGLEDVESAWTGGAGAAADMDSPFGWAEPEAAPSQATIGEYFDSLVAWAAPAEAPAPPEAALPPEAPPAPEAAPDIAATGPVAATTPRAAAAAAAAATPTSFDDIEALFSDVPAAPPQPWTPEPAAAAPTGGSSMDDIDALFGTSAPAAEPKPTMPAPTEPAPLDMATPAAGSPAEPPMLPPAVQEPDIAVSADPQVSPAPAAEAGFAWDPFAELTPPTPAPAPTRAVPDAAAASAAANAGAGGAFEWDPFAELPQSEDPATAPAPEPMPTDADAGDDDDEDIDMFRAWLQSLKR